MTTHGDGGGGKRPDRRRRPARCPEEPRHDPATPAGSSPEEWTNLPFNFRRSTDEYVVETLELAAMLAEEAVVPFKAARTGSRFRGASHVEMRFHDRTTLFSFKRTGSIHAVKNETAWRLVRRWADGGGDGSLDEAMCCVVARWLNEDFGNLLEARVVTWIMQ